MSKEDTTDDGDPRTLVIRNLDTGEEFTIGVDEPTFEHDTFANLSIMGNVTEMKEEGGEEKELPSFWANLWTSIVDTISSLFEDEEVQDMISSSNSDSLSTSSSSSHIHLRDLKVLMPLGKGAFGQVVLVRHLPSSELFAVKILEKAKMRRNDREQAKTERQVLAIMSGDAHHPFIANLRFALQSDRRLYLGMPYIPGGNLKSHLRRLKRFHESWARFYVAEIVTALSHLHALNVVYRDIKPHNVVVGEDGHLVLVDFGLAKRHVKSPRGANSLVGTPDYSAPEVLRTGVSKNSSGKGYGKAADWWGVGVMTFEMIVGKPPFRGKNLRQVNVDPAMRLGAWDTPPRDIITHPFFRDLNWEELEQKRISPPFIPVQPPIPSEDIKTNRLTTCVPTADGEGGRFSEWSFWDEGIDDFVDDEYFNPEDIIKEQEEKLKEGSELQDQLAEMDGENIEEKSNEEETDDNNEKKISDDGNEKKISDDGKVLPEEKTHDTNSDEKDKISGEKNEEEENGNQI